MVHEKVEDWNEIMNMDGETDLFLLGMEMDNFEMIWEKRSEFIMRISSDLF